MEIDSELEDDDDDDETEIIYQRFLANHRRRENENKSKEENSLTSVNKCDKNDDKVAECEKCNFIAKSDTDLRKHKTGKHLEEAYPGLSNFRFAN